MVSFVQTQKLELQQSVNASSHMEEFLRGRVDGEDVEASILRRVRPLKGQKPAAEANIVIDPPIDKPDRPLT